MEHVHNFLELLCGALCHQLPERSFVIAGYTLPLCARCSGTVLGAFSCLLFFTAAKRFRGNKPPGIGLALVIALSVSPLAIDGVASFLGIHDSPAIFRLWTGIAAGYVFPVFVVLLTNYNENSDNKIPLIKGFKDITAILCIALLCLAVVRLFCEAYIMWLIVAIIQTVIVVCFYSIIPMFIIRVLPKKIHPIILVALSASSGLCLAVLASNMAAALLYY